MAKKTPADEIIRLHGLDIKPSEIAKFLCVDVKFVMMVIEQSKKG